MSITKDNTAVMDIVFVNGDTDKRTSQTIDGIKDILGDKGTLRRHGGSE